MRSVRQPHVQLVHFSSSASLLTSRLSPIASFSTTGARYLRTNHTPSRRHSPRLSFSFSFLSLFLRTLGNDDLHLAAAVRHPYARNSVLVSFSSFLLSFFLFS